MNPKELYITGIYNLLRESVLVLLYILCDKILSRYFWSTLNLAQWQTKLKEEGRNQGSTSSSHPSSFLCLIVSVHVARKIASTVVPLLIVKHARPHVRAISYLLRSSITWQAQKETKEPRLIYSWLTNLCKHSPTSTVLVSTAFLVLFSFRSYSLR